MTLRPLFLARQEYRRRRLRDAARLLPVAGGLLLLLPLLWQGQPEAPGAAQDGLWLFAVWFLMVAGAAALAPALAGQGRDDRGFAAHAATDRPAGAELRAKGKVPEVQAGREVQAGEAGQDAV